MTSSKTPDDWNRIKEIFSSAVLRPPEERKGFLDGACGGDGDLRREVESLLSSSQSAGRFMQEPAVGEVAVELAGPARKFQSGSILDHYHVVKLLGEGGMGEVYLAEDTRLERRVALKILPAAFAQDAERMRRFVQEAKSASALNHPNILTIYETGEFENTNYIASEYIDGETLRDRAANEPFSVKAAVDVAIQIAGALQAAHGAGIVHRDLKPDNIMIRPDGFAKILDFGIAKLIDEQPILLDAEASTAIHAGTLPGTIVGTANYMSPEQARGQMVDARSDIFSFGLVFYEMLSGKNAFDGENAIDVISAILHKEPLPLYRYLPEVPAEIERIVGKSLRKDREERYQTAKDLLIDLKDARQELEFQNKLERTSLPDRKAAQLEAVESTGADRAIPQTSSAEYLLREVGHHKRGALIALMVVIIAAVGMGYWYFSDRSTAAKRIESIAVLPFLNESGNADTEFLSDGMTETLISSLSQLPNLDIKARSSVFRYKGTNTDPHQIAKDLNVQALLSGRLLTRNSDLSLYVELVDISTDKVIWSQTYRNQMADLVALQNEIALDVAANLRSKLSAEQPPVKNHTENAETYQLYLRGRYEWNKHTQEGMQKAISYYEQALEKDPTYALAYVGLSACYGVLSGYVRPGDTFPKAKIYAQKALTLDDSLAEAHTAMAAVNLYFDRSWSEAEKELQRAENINPNDPDAHLLRSDLLLAFKRFDEARAEVNLAQELDPLSRINNTIVGANYYYARQYDEATAELERTINLDLGFSEAYLYLGQAYAQEKKYDKAIEAFQRGMRDGADPMLIAARGHAYARAGERQKALHALDELRDMSQHQYVSPYQFAVVYAGLGDKTQCFDWLEKAYNDHSVYLLWMNVEPQFDPIRDDPRFSKLVQRMGLP